MTLAELALWAIVAAGVVVSAMLVGYVATVVFIDNQRGRQLAAGTRDRRYGLRTDHQPSASTDEVTS